MRIFHVTKCKRPCCRPPSTDFPLAIELAGSSRHNPYKRVFKPSSQIRRLMFNIYQSNRLETLMAILDDRLAEADRNKAAFEPNTILIQSYGMGQWIKLQLAEARGVSGNVDCVLPPMMVWRLYGQLLQYEDIPQVSLFDVRLMTWNIM